MKIYNTLSRQKKDFRPHSKTVTMYVCGVNPYADAHIGHAMSYVTFDTVRRYLEYSGHKVKHVENVTDVEDNIINHANKLGISVKELTTKYTIRYFEDMDALNILRPHFIPKATETIPEIIEMTRGLIDRGFAYETRGSVYFRVNSMSDYGKLSHRTLDMMMAGARIEPGEEKEHPMDFVLWKAAKPGEPAWDSPWGKGRPGWHIECSAMSLKYLGETIDIHGGGQDLIFPHHENEIAQSECFTGKKPFVQYWMHNGLLQMGAEKMSKSLGNLITIRQALEKYSADGLRLFILSSYYRNPLTYSTEAMDAAEKGAERLRQVSPGKGKEHGEKVDAASFKQRFIEFMDDDFSTPQAIAVLFDLAREINRGNDEEKDTTEADATFRELAGVLGLTLQEPEEHSFEKKLYEEMKLLYDKKVYSEINKRIEPNLPRLDKYPSVRSDLLKSLGDKQVNTRDPSFIILETDINLNIASVESLHDNLKRQNYDGIVENLKSIASTADASTTYFANIRDQLRQTKQFKAADEIRDKLLEMDVVLEDTPQGTIWKRKK
ncbi:MAG: cysteine--tRNA ligase [Dehalococcoidales bacterium]|nr:cysteine--tRNA ligase [Dehalococcoidales bacterium]